MLRLFRRRTHTPRIKSRPGPQCMPRTRSRASALVLSKKGLAIRVRTGAPRHESSCIEEWTSIEEWTIDGAAVAGHHVREYAWSRA